MNEFVHFSEFNEKLVTLKLRNRNQQFFLKIYCCTKIDIEISLDLILNKLVTSLFFFLS